MKNLHKLVLKEFRKAIQDGLKVDGYDFARVVKETTEKAKREFQEGAKEVTLSETGWSAEETEAQLAEDMVAIADLLRVEETRKMVAVIEVGLCRALVRGTPRADDTCMCRGTSRSRLARRSS